jgi:hypothetical protein
MMDSMRRTGASLLGSMANYIPNRTPTSSNLGHMSPIEYLTNEVPGLSHLRVPFSPSYVAQEKKKGALSCRALEGIFVGYPEDTRDGVWVHYMPSTKSTQVSRHAVFSEWAHFKGPVSDELQSARRAELAVAVAALESATTAPASKSAPPPIVAGAITANHYFVCNRAQIDKATAYIRDRCIRFHGLRVSDALKGQFKQGKRWRNYPPSGLAYDLRCMWATTSATAPLPYHLVPISVGAILAVTSRSHHR